MKCSEGVIKNVKKLRQLQANPEPEWRSFGKMGEARYAWQGSRGARIQPMRGCRFAGRRPPLGSCLVMHRPAYPDSQSATVPRTSTVAIWQRELAEPRVLDIRY